MKKRLNGNAFIALLLIIVSAIVLYIANTELPAKAPAGDFGTRFFPTSICIIIIFLSIVIIIESMLNPVHRFIGTLKDPEQKASAVRAALILADLALFLIMWRYIPFLISGMIFMLIQCLIFKEKLLFSIIYSAAVTGVLYVMFAILLKVNLTIH